MDKIILRDGIPDDSSLADYLIYSTGSYFFDYLFPYDKDITFKTIRMLFRKDKGIFSHRFATIAEEDGDVLGLELGYSLREKRYHSFFNTLYIIRQHNLIQIFKMIFRDYNISKFLKRLKPNSYYIANLSVHPSAQGRGIGGKLLENAFTKAKSRSYQHCYLDVSIHNKNAIKLYNKYGFKIFKEVRNINLETKYKLHGQLRMIKKL
ncbi:MAG: hypothetical protein CMI53_01990 [Parcubacteria group bacterium]|nr:hypothetical protein [Parcubacteria group bacterium]|tara:strand:- start:252 stop:872 length:621 start_codon:yes stop_codon:yes gene_type:complete